MILNIDAATGQVEVDTGMALLTQTWLLERDYFNHRYKWIDLPIRPATEIVSVKYLDDEGNEQTWDPAEYHLDLSRNALVLNNYYDWPSTDGGIKIEWKAGFAEPQNVPAELRKAVMLQAGKWFENPTMDMPSSIGDEAYDRLVARYIRSDYP